MASENPTRSPRKKARAEQLLEVSCEVFGEKGYQHTKMEDIAERAGVTRATLYLYFKNKEELFSALVGSVVEDRRVLIDELERIRTPDPAADVNEALRLIQATIQIPRCARVNRLMSLGVNGLHDLALRYGLQNTKIVECLAVLIARASASGAFRRADAMRAARIAIMPASLSVFWLAARPTGTDYQDPPFVPQEFLAYQRDLFVRGMAADPAT